MHDVGCCCWFVFGAIKYSRPKKANCMCVFVCVFVKQQKKKTTNSFCGCHGSLFFFVMPIVYHRHTHTYRNAKRPTHTLAQVKQTRWKHSTYFLLKARLRFWFRLQIRCSLLLPLAFVFFWHWVRYALRENWVGIL